MTVSTNISRLSPTVIFLGIASFFTDLSSEMIYPLLPLFLASVLGAGALALGLIEGIAESTAAVIKMGTGIWSDRTRRRKPFILSGYGLAGSVRPLIGLATGWPFVLAMRFLDRVGKGLRTSPRDALIADATEPRLMGMAFGFHRSMDHAGAVGGPLLAAALLRFEGVSLRHIFLLAAIPAAVVMIILAAGVKEPRTNPAPNRKAASLKGDWTELGQPFKWLLLALLVFTLGNSTDAFLLLRLSHAGISASMIALLWSAHHVIKMVATYVGGNLSDRVGRRRMIFSGWLIYAAIYVAFAFLTSPSALITLLLLYGIYFGFTEPSEKAFIADHIPLALRATAFGYYHGVVGLAALPASFLFGLLWSFWGAPVAFLTGAGLALTASMLLLSPPARAPRADNPS